ncbi:hypothetical protein [Minwuia sp.]|uniref:hypothetical protein n=1 Tax=Minwuia sp. TaxID=2493630 RepID=UPI003A9160F6
MGKRRPVRAETVSAVAAENAGHPLDDARAAIYAEALEPILQGMEAIRALPLKNLEPATVFQPVEGKRHD